MVTKSELLAYYSQQREDAARMYGDTARAHKQKRRLELVERSLKELHLESLGLFLDIGCGDGYAAAHVLAECGPDTYVGIDLSRFKLKALAERIGGAIVFAGDAECIPIRRDIVDAILCSETLEHLIDPHAALAEIARILRPGGYCVISIPVDSLLQKPIIQLAGLVRRLTGRRNKRFNEHIQIFTRRRIKTLLARHKLRTVCERYCAFNLPVLNHVWRRLPYRWYVTVDRWLSRLPIQAVNFGTAMDLSLGRDYAVIVAQKDPDWVSLRRVYDARALQACYTRSGAGRRLSRKHAELIARLSLIQGARILDAGCGNGPYTAPLSLRDDTLVVGMDLSPRILTQAANRVAVEGNPRAVRLAAANLEALPFQDSTFDAVISSQVIEHLLDDEKGLAELCRVLTSSGFLLISTDNKLNWVSRGLALPVTTLKRLLGVSRSRLRFPHKAYAPEEFARMLSTAGFQVQEVHTFRFSLESPLWQLQLLTRGLDALERRLIRWPLFRNWGDIIVAKCCKRGNQK